MQLRQLVGAAEHTRKELHGKNIHKCIEGTTEQKLNLSDCRNLCYKGGKGQISQVVGKIGKENLVGLLMEKLENDKGPNYNLSQTTVTLCFPSCHRQTFFKLGKVHWMEENWGG